MQHHATKLSFKCRQCGAVKTIVGGPGVGGYNLPKACDSITVQGEGNTCGPDPFYIQINKSEYVDRQRLRLQVTLLASIALEVY